MINDPIPYTIATWHNILAKPNESLIKHTWYVLSRLADQVRLHPNLAIELETPDLWHWLYWGIFLHDFGKCASGFQDVLKGKSRLWGYRHEALSLAFVDWLFPRGNEHRNPVIAVIACHHKDVTQIIDEYGYADSDYPEDALAPQMVQQVNLSDQIILYQWLSICGWAWAKRLGFEPYISPVTMPTEAKANEPIQVQRIYEAVEDLLHYTSSLTFTKNPQMAQIGMLLRGIILIADHAGSAESKDKPFTSLDLSSQLLKSKTELYPHQRQTTNADNGSAILIAPTGSGKTEAALLWLKRQAELDHTSPSHLFYILPYQASMNAMYRRLERIFGKDYIGLQHGRSQQAIYYITLESELDTEKPNNVAQLNEEFSRLHRYPLNIQSPYQMLKAAYQIKGHEALFASFQQGRFILDEIHAYEPDRLALIVRFMKFLREHAAARFFVMSATMPTHIQRVLQEALPDLQMITATSETFAEFKRHCVHLLDGSLSDDSTLDCVCMDAVKGKSVLVCCNTVKRAKEIYQKLKARLLDHPIILVHSRFNGRDRNGKEDTIIKQVGVESKESERAKPVVVATQVVEVSLNIDMDTLYTENAPLEALLQRFGRVNRSRRMSLADVYVVREQPENVTYLYLPVLIDATLKKLERLDHQAIDESAVNDWLDEIYAGETLKAWQAEYDVSLAKFESEILNGWKPFVTDHEVESSFYQMFNGVEVLPADDFPKYEDLLKRKRFLEASMLLVPVRWDQYKRLENAKKASQEIYRLTPKSRGFPIYTVEASYSSESGLDIEGALEIEVPPEAD
jgi:CRISPR-associated endonuclease/helicase Cas3